MNLKFLFVMFVCMFCLNGAYSLTFMNLSWHEANDNNNYTYVESAFKNGTNEYLSNLTSTARVQVLGSRHISTLSNLYMSFEIYANISSPYYTNNKLNIDFHNAETNTSWKYEARIYDTYSWINRLSCYGQPFPCIWLDGVNSINEGNGSRSIIIDIPMSEISNKLGLSGGVFSNNNEYSYGMITAFSLISDSTGINYYSSSKNQLLLLSVEELEVNIANKDRTVEDLNYISYFAKWRGFYNPADLGIAIWDNTTYSEHLINGFAYNVQNITLAYKENDIATNNREWFTLFNNQTIFDMTINGFFTTNDFSSNLSAGNYYIIIYQKKFLSDNTYYLVIGSQSFTYSPKTNFPNTKTYSFNLNNHLLYNTSLARVFYKVYDWDLTSDIANGNIQPNYLDINIYYLSKSTGVKTYTNYSVITEGSSIYLTVDLTNYNDMKNNNFYVNYNSPTTIINNPNYESNIKAGLYLNSSVMTLAESDIYSILAIDSFNISNNVTGGVNCHLIPTCSNTIKIYDLSKSVYNSQYVTCTSSSCVTSQIFVNAGNVSNSSFYTESNKKTLTSYISEATSWTKNSSLFLNMLALNQLSSTNLILTWEVIHGGIASDGLVTGKNNGLIFNNNVWNLTLTDSENNIEPSITEIDFHRENTYSFSQDIEVSSGYSSNTLFFYDNDNNIKTILLDANSVNRIYITWILPNGNHELKVTMYGATPISHEVDSYNSTVSVSNALIGSITPLNGTGLSAINLDLAKSTTRGFLDKYFTNSLDGTLVVMGVFLLLGLLLAFKTGEPLSLIITLVIGLFANGIIYGSVIFGSVFPFILTGLGIVILGIFGYVALKIGGGL